MLNPLYYSCGDVKTQFFQEVVFANAIIDPVVSHPAYTVSNTETQTGREPVQYTLVGVYVMVQVFHVSAINHMTGFLSSPETDTRDPVVFRALSIRWTTMLIYLPVGSNHTHQAIKPL